MAAPSSETRSLPKVVKLISTDFDGTLVGSDKGEAALPEFFRLLREQRAKHGVIWVINTGRSWDTLELEIQKRNFPIWPDWVVLAEREVHRVRRQGIVGDYTWNHRCEEIHRELFQETKTFWKALREYVTSETGAEVLADHHSPLTIRARTELEATRIHCHIKELLEGFKDLTVVRNSVYFRFAHRDFHKGSSLGRIQECLGISPGQTLVAGDHYNDLPMFDTRYARFWACPGNSIVDVRVRVQFSGGYLARGTEAAGVVEAWKRLIS